LSTPDLLTAGGLRNGITDASFSNHRMRRMAEGSASPSPLVIDRVGARMTIALNRPERGNALTGELKAELLTAVRDAGADPTVRAVVLTGSGTAFCAGQDLAEHAAALDHDPATAFDTIAEHYTPIVTALSTMPKPVLAAINGTCVGAGLGLALACDLRIAVAGAKLATAFTAIGLTCDSGLSASLVRAVGQARASHLLLLGAAFTAEEAAEWGLVSDVVDAADLAAAADALGDRLASGPTLAYAATKRLLATAVHPPLSDVLSAEESDQRQLGLSADHRGAVDAFLAKRRPEFGGG
jgi:2-(1,2-epoxy-1,2-dihydrophenyl)acetyl-CoA isomerase